MLAVVLLSVGSTFVFSNLAVAGNQFRRLPPDVQQYLRAQKEAQRRLKPPSATLPPPRPATLGPQWPPDLNQSGLGLSRLGLSTPDGTAAQRSDAGSPTRRFRSRNQDFLKDIQQSLVRPGLLAAAASALLAFLLSRRLARPILAVSAAAAGMARGDLSIRAPILSGERELGRTGPGPQPTAHTSRPWKPSRGRRWPTLPMSCVRRWRSCRPGWTRWKTACTP